MLALGVRIVGSQTSRLVCEIGAACAPEMRAAIPAESESREVSIFVKVVVRGLVNGGEFLDGRRVEERGGWGTEPSSAGGVL